MGMTSFSGFFSCSQVIDFFPPDVPALCFRPFHQFRIVAICVISLSVNCLLYTVFWLFSWDVVKYYMPDSDKICQSVPSYALKK